VNKIIIATPDQVAAVTEAVAVHTPDLVELAPDGVSSGRHLYCVECGVLPADGLGLQYGPQHVAERVLAALGMSSQGGRAE
jgi:hypothetical protein